MTTTTIITTPAALREMLYNGDALRVASIQGVGGLHELILVMESGGWPVRLVYLTVPDGGPIRALQSWSETPREFRSWEIPQDRDLLVSTTISEDIEREAIHWVVDQAMDEVTNEASS